MAVMQMLFSLFNNETTATVIDFATLCLYSGRQLLRLVWFHRMFPPCVIFSPGEITQLNKKKPKNQVTPNNIARDQLLWSKWANRLPSLGAHLLCDKPSHRQAVNFLNILVQSKLSISSDKHEPSLNL